MFDPLDIIKEFYKPGTKAYEILVGHCRQVTAKALESAEKVPHLKPDLTFIAQAAMLHDIGICLTDAAGLDCHGKQPYLMHGTLGRKMLEEKGLPDHALVCERHVGVGISTDDIAAHNLPLPRHDMQPVSIEEQIVCFADKFFSKNGTGNGHEKPIPTILAEIAAYGPGKVERFKGWLKLFKGVSSGPGESCLDLSMK